MAGSRLGTRGGPGGARPGNGRKSGSQNKVKAELAVLCRTYTVEALEALVGVMRNGEAPHAAVVTAAIAILDRGHGKPMQAVSGLGAGGAIVVQIVGDDKALL